MFETYESYVHTGRLFFSNTVCTALGFPNDAALNAAHIGFLAPNGPGCRPFHAFFYNTAVQQGFEAEFEKLPRALLEYFAENTDDSNGGREYHVEEVKYTLQLGEEIHLINLARAVTPAM